MKRLRMANSVKLLFTLLIFGCISTDFGESFCSPGAPPVIAGQIRLPRKFELLPLRTFDELIAGQTLYEFYEGVSLSERLILEKAEVVYTRPSPDILRLDLKALLNGACVYEDILPNQEFDIFFSGRRAEFQSSLSGTYLAAFTSNPSSYIWTVICRNYRAGMVLCPVDDVIYGLFTRENPPNNLNLEEAGRDLRTRTCLDMELIPGRFTFLFEQGINTCPDDDVPY